MTKKILKNLILQKEELVNLNDKQMDSAVGGTSPLTTSSEMCAYTIEFTVGATIEPGLNYLYNFVTQKIDEYNSDVNTINYNRVSEIVCMGGCMLPDVYVNGNH